MSTRPRAHSTPAVPFAFRVNIVFDNGTVHRAQASSDPWSTRGPGFAGVWYQAGFLADSLRLGWQGLFWESALGGNALYYARARWYDPRTKRFLSPDPLGVEAGVNAYVFAGNDPLNLRDPFGRRPCRDGEVLHTDVSVVTSGKGEDVITATESSAHYCPDPDRSRGTARNPSRRGGGASAIPGGGYGAGKIGGHSRAIGRHFQPRNPQCTAAAGIVVLDAAASYSGAKLLMGGARGIWTGAKWAFSAYRAQPPFNATSQSVAMMSAYYRGQPLPMGPLPRGTFLAAGTLQHAVPAGALLAVRLDEALTAPDVGGPNLFSFIPGFSTVDAAYDATRVCGH